MADWNSYFVKGAEVEISNDEEGFRGAWFAGIVIQPATKRRKQLLVEYKTLDEADGSSKRLQESLDLVQLRPPPPRELNRTFKFSEEVDAYHNGAWWEGVITEVLGNERFAVFFRSAREQLVFKSSNLRLHREWVNGDWVPPLEEEASEFSEPNLSEVEPTDEREVGKFTNGMLVEVSSDDDGFQGAWFGATVIEHLSDDKYLIEYLNLRNDDNTELLREEIDSLHIRPQPPDASEIDHFNALEEVDALYNDGWWVGVVSRVLRGNRYLVYFRGTEEELEFKRSDLRLHQDWVQGDWVIASRALK